MAKPARKQNSTKHAILDVAERMAREGGYHDVSFRRIADDVGIKSASVFHHFANKEQLGAAMARRYIDRFMETIGDPDDPGTTGEEKLARYIKAFSHALKVDRQMCLCGMLGAEIDSLPKDVASEARRFFNVNIDWLETALTRKGGKAGKKTDIRGKALLVMSALDGAMLISRATGDNSSFDQVSELVSRLVQNQL